MRGVTVEKSLVARRFLRSLATYDGAAVVQREMAERLVGGLLSARADGRFDDVLELGCGTGLLTERLLQNCRLRRLVLNDLVPECESTARRHAERRPGVSLQFVRGDMEAVEFPCPQDLIASSAALQWAADMRGLLARMSALLRSGGVLAIAAFGPSNLREVSDLTGRSLRYRALAEWREALAGAHEILNGFEDLRTLWFASAREVLRHLRQTGVNALEAEAWSPSKVRRFCRAYEATFGRNGGVPLTYHPVFIIARKRFGGGLCV